MRLIKRFLIPCLLICITGSVFGKEGMAYSFSQIKFREAQYPEKIGIILLVPKSLWFHPGMVVVSDGSVEGMGADVNGAVLSDSSGFSAMGRFFVFRPRFGQVTEGFRSFLLGPGLVPEGSEMDHFLGDHFYRRFPYLTMWPW